MVKFGKIDQLYRKLEEKIQVDEVHKFDHECALDEETGMLVCVGKQVTNDGVRVGRFAMKKQPTGRMVMVRHGGNKKVIDKILDTVSIK